MRTFSDSISAESASQKGTDQGGGQTIMSSFLLVGQSNMAGRGDLDGIKPIIDPSCFMLRMGRWQAMLEPVNVDRAVISGFGPRSGACLATSFATTFAKTFHQKIGLIPCADGGTTIEQWAPGGILFDHAVMMAKLAMRTSVLSGILWHQGESDCDSFENAEVYGVKFLRTMTAFRAEFGDIPIIVGELGYPEYGFTSSSKDIISKFNSNLAILTHKVSRCALVKSDGLFSRGDGLHFDTPSLRKLGVRYFEQYLLLREK